MEEAPEAAEGGTSEVAVEGASEAAEGGASEAAVEGDASEAAEGDVFSIFTVDGVIETRGHNVRGKRWPSKSTYQNLKFISTDSDRSSLLLRMAAK